MGNADQQTDTQTEYRDNRWQRDGSIGITLQREEEGERETVHGDHAIQGCCQHKDGHSHFSGVEPASSGGGQGGGGAGTAV